MYDLQAPCFLSNWLIFQRRVAFCPITTTSSIVPPFIGFSFASHFFHPSLSFLSWRSHAVSAVNQQAEGMFPRVWGAESPPGFRGDRIAGQFLAAGQNLALRKLREGCAFSLRPFFARSLLKMLSHRLFCRAEGLATKWIYRNGEMVIKWIRLYPTYNHSRRLKIYRGF